MEFQSNKSHGFKDYVFFLPVAELKDFSHKGSQAIKIVITIPVTSNVSALKRTKT